MTALFSLFLLALLYPSTYSFLLSWLPFLAILKIPLVSFSSVSGHICMRAHTHSVKVKNVILVLTVAIKGAPTKCAILSLYDYWPTACTKLCLWQSVLSPSLLSCVCARSRIMGKCEAECDGCVTLCWEMGNPWLSIVEWEPWWLHGIGVLTRLFISVGRFGVQCSAVTLKSPGTSNIIELQYVCIYGMWAREKERELISTFLSLMCFPDPYSQIFFSWCKSFASLLSKPAQPQSIGFTDW